MSICRGCGREIDWIRTVAGKNMPADPAPFPSMVVIYNAERVKA